MKVLRASRSIRRNTWLFVLGMCALLAALDGGWIVIDRGYQVRQATTETSNLARSLAEHAQSAFRLADAVLLESRELMESDGTDANARHLLDAQLASRVRGLPLLRSIVVTDDTGHVVASSAAIPAGGSVAGREDFERLRESPNREPVIGTMQRSPLDESWSIRIARRIDHADGSFAGIVAAAIDLGFFVSYYRSFDVGRSGAISLLTVGGELLAREPFVESWIGADFADSALIRDYLPRSPVGAVEQVSRTDGSTRMLSYSRLGGFPLVVAVARSKTETLAQWRLRAWTYVAGLVVVVLVIGVLANRLTEQIQERERLERERTALAAEYRLLTENATDLVARLGPDLVYRYASPSARSVVGYEPTDLVGHTPQVIVSPEDWPGAERSLRELMDPSGPEQATIRFRGRCRDGSTIWLEGSGKRLAGAGGLVLACRDITLRKQAEDQLERMTREDGLTGLANRRGLDEWLDREFRRAARSDSPIVIIMVDVDLFKAFNDTYGHQDGDACLQAIAAVVSAAARRPGDLAARYGGEELALVMADVDLHDAMHLAEQIRAAVCALGIAHSGSPLGIVTISLGVASVASGASRGTAETLLKAGDDALYAAKRGGRNAVRSAEGASGAGRAVVPMRHRA